MRWFTGDTADRTVGGHGCWTKGCVLHFVLDVATPGRVSEQRRSKTKLGSGLMSVAVGVSCTGDKRVVGEIRRGPPGGMGGFLFPAIPEGGMAQTNGVQGAAGSIPVGGGGGPWHQETGV